MFTADRRLWLTADKKSVVEEGDPLAAFLLAAPGDELDDETAARYGLKAKAKTADKARGPAANK